MESNLLPDFFRRKLIEASSIKNERDRMIEIEKITEKARQLHPELFRRDDE